MKNVSCEIILFQLDQWHWILFLNRFHAVAFIEVKSNRNSRRIRNDSNNHSFPRNAQTCRSVNNLTYIYYGWCVHEYMHHIIRISLISALDSMLKTAVHNTLFVIREESRLLQVRLAHIITYLFQLIAKKVLELGIRAKISLSNSIGKHVSCIRLLYQSLSQSEVIISASCSCS